MKKTIILLALALTAAAASRAQNTIVSYTQDGATVFDAGDIPRTVLDTATLAVSYRMSYLRRPEQPKPMEDVLLLEIGRNVSKCYSYKSYQTDSLVRVTPPEQVMANIGNFRGGVQFVVFQDRGRGEMTYVEKVMKDYLIYTEPLPAFEWKLEDQTREILGYVCRRATCSFAGRKYVAWYASEIPLDLGPWKFRGLPGLILAVADDAGVLSLEASGIVRRRVPVTMDDRNYLKTSRKKLLATVKKAMIDPIGFLRTNSNINMTIRNADGTPVGPGELIRTYNPIELK